MARLVGIEPVTAAIVQTLRASAGVTAHVPSTRIVNEARPGLERPYVVVEIESEEDDDTLGLAGVDSIVSTRIVSAYAGDAEIGRIASAIRTALDAQEVAVPGFTSPADVTYEQAIPGYSEEIAGVKVRHRPLWFRVRVN